MDSQTKRDFEEAFWRLYAHDSIEQISIRELCQVAGYNRSTFYRHFDNIYDLLDMVESDLLEDMEHSIEACPNKPTNADLMTLMKQMLTFYYRNRSKIVILLGPNGDASFVKRLKSTMMKMPIWRVLDPSLNIPDNEMELLLGQTVSGVISLITDWLEDSRGVSATRMLRIIYDTSIKR